MSSHLITLRGVRFNRRPLCYKSSRLYEVRLTVDGRYCPPDTDAAEDRGSFRVLGCQVHSIATGSFAFGKAEVFHYVWQESDSSPRGIRKVDDLFCNDDDLADATSDAALAIEIEERW